MKKAPIVKKYRITSEGKPVYLKDVKVALVTIINQTKINSKGAN